MNTFIRIIVAALLSASAAVASAEERQIMAWGAQPTESAAPFVNSVRMGCTGAPADCIAAYKATPGINYLSIAFGQASDPVGTLERAKNYSLLSVKSKALKEVSLDDAWGFLYQASVQDKGEYFRSLVDSVKSTNKGLLFGITLYEEEIAKIQKAPDMFPADARSKVDRVALYLIYRSNWPNYSNYVVESRRLFPNAKIYAGVYHYDRSDYIPCQQGGKNKCSDAEEISMFNSAFQEQLKLLKSGEVEGLELYPGFLGKEQEWSGWKNKNLCANLRVDKCIANSRSMAKETLQLLK
ncbi:hypothetical protein ACSFBI_33350 [Variovorax sp. RB3P1]|uniref:hypothetical protein n=1 Tax=Variovorax sp. RB3P1 TaxID=3443732 RepID=UPI003F472A23